MKLKLLVIMASLMLTGCAANNVPIFNADEVGIARTAADREQYQGEFDFKGGTGLIYTRKTNQCGNNCAQHAELAKEIEAQKDAQARAGNPEWERIVAREKAAYKRQEVFNRCHNGAQLHLAAYQDKFNDSMKMNGFDSPETRAAGKKLVEFERDFYSLVNQCVDKYNK